MDMIRKILKWISLHRIVSFLVFVLFSVMVIFGLALKKRSEGTYTLPLQRGTTIDAVYGIGTVTANRIWRITPGLITNMTDLWVKEGDHVKKGARLLESDRSIWRAPFEGTVTSLSFKIGENTFPSTSILTLVDMKDRYLVVSMEQQGALRVRPGQKVKLSFDTLREKSYDGKVMAVYSNDTNYLARIDIGNFPEEILPGMTADTAIEIAQHENVLLGSTAALENGKTVWRKRGHEIPKKIEVKVGVVDRDKFEILAGDLQVGDRLLIRKDLNK
jgi:macrolide-specific efflux system membrane fusion protein